MEDDRYTYCPLCGEDWGNEPKAHKCDLMKLIDNKRPRFYMMDLQNYISEFLIDIIKWQNMKIKAFNGEDPDEFDLELKDNSGIINKFAKSKDTNSPEQSEGDVQPLQYVGDRDVVQSPSPSGDTLSNEVIK